MKLELEPHDIEAIAQRVAELLRPLLKQQQSPQGEESILTVKTLAEYLNVSTAWVYKYVSLRQLPYFKSGKYTRFKKSEIDEWITQNGRPIYTPTKRSGG